MGFKKNADYTADLISDEKVAQIFTTIIIIKKIEEIWSFAYFHYSF